MTEFHTTKAVEQQNDHQSRDTWSIADAILADVPDESHGDFSTRVERFEAIAREMADRDLLAPNGQPYTVDALRHLRNTAIAWPENERHSWASYRTHQEAGGRDSIGRVALAALVEFAENGSVITPSNLDVDAFEQAIDMVGNSKARYPVSANALRTALEKKRNIPARIPTTSVEYHAMIAETKRNLKGIAKSYANHDDNITELERDGLVSALNDLMETVKLVVGMIRGVTEIDLAYLESSDHEL